MARLIALKQTAPERFLARFDTGEELRTTLAVVTDYHLSCGRELTAAELDALRAASIDERMAMLGQQAAKFLCRIKIYAVKRRARRAVETNIHACFSIC